MFSLTTSFPKDTEKGLWITITQSFLFHVISFITSTGYAGNGFFLAAWPAGDVD